MSHLGNDAVIEQIRDEIAEMSRQEKLDVVLAQRPWVIGKYLDIAVADVLIETWPDARGSSNGDAVIEQIRDQVAEMSQDEKIEIAISSFSTSPQTRDLYRRWVLSWGGGQREVLEQELDKTVADILIEAWPEGGDE